MDHPESLSIRLTTTVLKLGAKLIGRMDSTMRSISPRREARTTEESTCFATSVPLSSKVLPTVRVDYCTEKFS